jgi:hypothetical protein
MRNCGIASAERAELLLVDTSVARNVAIGGWPRKLLFLSGGEILVADRVLGSCQDYPSELRKCRDHFAPLADNVQSGSIRISRAQKW